MICLSHTHTSINFKLSSIKLVVMLWEARVITLIDLSRDIRVMCYLTRNPIIMQIKLSCRLAHRLTLVLYGLSLPRLALGEKP